MNSSALSDGNDEKFSTRALRGFGHTSEHDYENARMQRQIENADGMGLSTHVETSDKGSRKFMYHNEERIDEVEEEGSGRTSPPGTIGEAHEYMSENIESHVVHKIIKNKGTGNQSVIAAKERVRNVGFERQDENSDVEACSQVAVIRDKIPLSNDNKHFASFKQTYDALFSEFHRKLQEEYQLMKESYIQDYQTNYQINVNEKQANVDQFLETIDMKRQHKEELKKEHDLVEISVDKFLQKQMHYWQYRTLFKFLKLNAEKSKKKKV